MTTVATRAVPTQRTGELPPAGVPHVPRTLVRLRPIVHATPTAQGVHIRGWSSSFTVKGGSGLWKLWQILAGRLIEGLPAEQVVAPTGRPEVVRAVTVLLEQLREHDMLVELPAGWVDGTDPAAPPADVSAWLSSVAADPADAWRRLRTTPVRLTGDGPVAEAAARALAGLGVDVVPGALPAATEGVTDLVLSTEAGFAVAARCRGEVGLVVPVSEVDSVLWSAREVTRRLAGAAEPGGAPYALSALVGSAAAHRLACAVAGLADPAVEAAELHDDDQQPAPARLEHPSVLVARLDPLSLTYHPFLPAAPAAPPADTVDEALRRIEALVDAELGPLAEPVAGSLPQVPAGLAAADGVVGVGASTDAARLDAVLRQAEAVLAGGDAGHFAVGVHDRHAQGAALRRLADAAVEELATTPVADDEWVGSPAARRWWKALTLRFGRPAWIHVRRLAPDAVHAQIACGGEVIAWAVEAETADAVAFAALAAVGAAQAREAGLAVPPGPATLSGAMPVARPAGEDVTPWSDGWHWPAGVDQGEDRLQAALRALPPVARATVWRLGELSSAEDGMTEQAAQLRRALSAVGFTVVRWAS